MYEKDGRYMFVIGAVAWDLVAGVGEIINKNNKETENEYKLKDAVLSAYPAKFDAERCIIDHKRMVREIGLRMTSLDKVIEGNDTPQILAAVKDLEENLVFNNLSSSSSREIGIISQLN